MESTLRLRQCLGKFATGVTVVSCRSSDGSPCGITVNSFSSVSLEPPLVLWSIAKVSQSLAAYLESECFGINVLSREQQALSVRFARSERGLFEGIDFDPSPRNVPMLRDTLASFECRLVATHEYGDHHIVVGEVIDFQYRNGEPLLFFGGNYHALKR